MLCGMTAAVAAAAAAVAAAAVHDVKCRRRTCKRTCTDWRCEIQKCNHCGVIPPEHTNAFKSMRTRKHDTLLFYALLRWRCLCRARHSQLAPLAAFTLAIIHTHLVATQPNIFLVGARQTLSDSVKQKRSDGGMTFSQPAE